ncbi:MAG: CdvA-like protein [Desulfurococcales archaeon]|nr:CdvA-like protein [Desulfurococcales archaeon]
MSVTIDQVEKFIGQYVKEEYGRVVGKVLTAFTDITGEVESIEVAVNDSTLEKIEADRIKLTPDGLVIVPEWKVRALSAENKLDRVRKRLRAIEEHYRKGSIPVHAYEDMKRRLERGFEKVKSEVRDVKEALKRRANDLEYQITRLERDISNLMMLYMSNEVSESSYKAAIEYLKDSKTRCIEEKKDIEKHMNLIAKLESEASDSHHVPVTSEEKAHTPESVEGPIQVQIMET